MPSTLPAPHLREPGEAEADEPVGDICVRIQMKDPKTRAPVGPATITCYDQDGEEIGEAEILAEANRGEGKQRKADGVDETQAFKDGIRAASLSVDSL